MCHDFHVFKEYGKYRIFGLKVVLLVMSPIDSSKNRILLKATIFFSNLIVKDIPIVIHIIVRNNIYAKGTSTSQGATFNVTSA
jgi:hypothetical protein